MARIQEHPHYAEGFYDACAGDPLFDDATAEYRAGWEAAWECKAIVAAMRDRAKPGRREAGS